MKHKFALPVMLLLLGAVIGCPTPPPTLPPSTTGGGFSFHTSLVTNGVAETAAGVHLNGQWQQDLLGAAGDATTWNRVSNFIGIAVADGKRAPATWKVTWVSGGSDACDGMNGTTDITVGQVVQASCEVTVIETAVDIHPTAYSFSPTPIYTDGSSGDTALIAGPGFSAQFGMPLVQYFDLSGNLLAQTNVTAVASDGSWASGPVPDISQLGVGTYVGIVSNAKADGSYGSLGAVPVNVMLPPPPPPPPDPCPGARCINQCYDQGLKQWTLVAALLFSVQL